MKLTDIAMQSFQIGKVFSDNTARINSVDFSQSGELLVTSADDDSIHIYDCNDGVMQRTLYSKKYGVSNIRFAHAGTTVVHASTKENHTIRYLSLHDNKYIRYFSGHKDRVMNIDVSPVDDTFLSSSLDTTVRLWDMRSTNCAGVVHCGVSACVVSFGSGGLVFGVGVQQRTINLYDARNHDKGPFGVIDCPSTPWTGMKFSPDGKYVVVYSVDGIVSIYDSFTYKLHHQINCGVVDMPDIEFSFTADSQYLIGCGVDASIIIWRVDTAKEVAVLTGHPSVVGPIKFNPKFAMFVSADKNLAFWLPSVDDSY